MRYRWENCPANIRRQIDEVVDCVRGNLKGNLAGIYLHGSLAMGGFNPRASDVDMLVVSERKIALAAEREIVKCLLRVSGHPAPVEATFISREQLKRWRYPTPFDFHFSESWREKYSRRLNRTLALMATKRDVDLAIQIPTARERGICLYGRTARIVLPKVPDSDSVASVVQDFYWARRRIAQIPVYFVLNACRIYVFILTRRIFSKVEGSAWALRAIPKEHRPVVRAARESYRRGASELHVPSSELQSFARWIAREIRDLARIDSNARARAHPRRRA